MSALLLSSPFPVFTDKNGNPLEDGYMYIGTQNLNPETNPIAVYFDSAMTIPAAQPIRTIGGYPSRNGSAAQLYVSSSCSITVRDKKRGFIFNDPVFTGSAAQQIVVDSIASLTLIIGLSGQNISTLGYYADGDGGANNFYYSTSSSATDNGGTVIKPTSVSGAGRWLAVDTKTATVEQFGAKGDGSFNDTTVIQAALDSNVKEIIFSRTYLVGALTLAAKKKLVFVGGAKLKGRSLVTYVLSINAGAEYSTIYNLNIDGNRSALTYAGNKSGGLIVSCQNVSFAGNTISDNCLGIAVNVSSSNCTFDNVSTTNSAWGFYAVNADYLKTKDVSVLSLNANISNNYPHGFDLKTSSNCNIGIITVKDATGDTSGSDPFLSAVTIDSVANAKVAGFEVSNMASSTLKPLALSIIGADKCTFGAVNVSGYGGGRHVEIIGFERSTIDLGTISGGFEARGGGASGSSSGIIVSNSGTYSDGVGRANSAANTSIIRGGYITGMLNCGVLCIGSNIVFEKTKCHGNLIGWAINAESLHDNQTSSGAFPTGSFINTVSNVLLDNCEAQYNDQNGVFVGTTKRLKIIGGVFENNNQSAGAFAGVQLDGASTRVVSSPFVSGASVGDRQSTAYPLTGGALKSASLNPTQTLSTSSSFAVSMLNADEIGVNQRLSLIGVGTAGVDVAVKVLSKTLDEITVIPTSYNGAVVMAGEVLTGSISATAGSKTITGTGTLFISQLPQRMWVKLNATSEYVRVVKVLSDTVCYAETNVGTTTSGGSILKYRCPITAAVTQTTGVKVVGNCTDVRVPSLCPNGSSNALDFASITSISEMAEIWQDTFTILKTGNSTVATGATITFPVAFPTGLTPKVVATVGDSTVYSCSVYNVSVSGFSVAHNGVGSRVISWSASYVK